MPDISVNIEVYCASCGDGLCNQTEFTRTRHRQEPSFRVEPCTRCLNAAREEGRQEGRQEGREEMREEMEDDGE